MDGGSGRAHPGLRRRRSMDEQTLIDVLLKASRPLAESEVRAEVIVGEHNEGAFRLAVGALHVLDEITVEIPVLKPDLIAGLLQDRSDPGRPRTISLVE